MTDQYLKYDSPQIAKFWPLEVGQAISNYGVFQIVHLYERYVVCISVPCVVVSADVYENRT